MSTREVKSHRRAIVIGASMAGLLAGRVLADHFDEVTLLERDTFPQQATSRKGVPQGRHTHVLLEKGRSTMESYLPGLTERLIEAGAVRMSDISQNVRWFHSGAYHQAGVSDLAGVGVPRPTLEATVREQVSALSNVTILERCSVLELATTADQRRVTGVHIRMKDKGSSSSILNADLVVDASGRGSRSPMWLETLGYERPATDEIRIGLGYVTCHYPRTPSRFPNLNGIVILASPPSRRIAILLAQEDNQWVLTVGGYLGDHAPTDYEGFVQTVRNLPTPDIYNTIRDLDPLDGPVAYGFPANLRHRYER
ncbi:MAG: FAD-dependent oxidoreductase, partial [Caldilineaceae bacterium]